MEGMWARRKEDNAQARAEIRTGQVCSGAKRTRQVKGKKGLQGKLDQVRMEEWGHAPEVNCGKGSTDQPWQR